MTATERQLVVFSLDGEECALPITAVREIIRYVRPRATATASGVIKGMISVRGRTLPVVEVARRLGRELEPSRRSRILVIEVSNGSLGVIVDAVDGIVHVPGEWIESLPAAADKSLGDEIAVVGDRLIVLIDAERAFGDLLLGRPGGRPRASRRSS